LSCFIFIMIVSSRRGKRRGRRGGAGKKKERMTCPPSSKGEGEKRKRGGASRSFLFLGELTEGKKGGKFGKRPWPSEKGGDEADRMASAHSSTCQEGELMAMSEFEGRGGWRESTSILLLHCFHVGGEPLVVEEIRLGGWSRCCTPRKGGRPAEGRGGSQIFLLYPTREGGGGGAS